MFGVMISAAGPATGPHGTDWGQVLTRAGVGLGIAASIATIIAGIPVTRNGVLWAWRALLLRAGFPYRQYAKWFVGTWGEYWNPYLNDREKVSLSSTYVPLAAQSGSRQEVTDAREVLRSRKGRGIITGDPGSGKSTLLAAYGVEALGAGVSLSTERDVIPFLIQLRDLADYLPVDTETTPGKLSDNKIADYICQAILEQQAKFSPVRAAEFFSRSLARDRVMVMLDGLDEIPDDKQRSMRAAVQRFTEDNSVDRPTAKAMVLVTCRTQNFELLRGAWIPSFVRDDHRYSLAPLRDSEINSYLRKLKHKFTDQAAGPGRFMRSARNGNKLDLLRAPLILAMAVGIYAENPSRIPDKIGKLYDEMITTMLHRHAFEETDSEHTRLSYDKDDKYRFLQQFASRIARESGNFGDFTKAGLVNLADQLTSSLDNVDRADKFVEEIVRHSGLLSSAGRGNLWHFAHRSIHEYLAAMDLRTDPQGDAFLLARASDLNWRQAIQFYTADRDPRLVDGFLCQLAAKDGDLAVHCLQSARPSDDAANEVIGAAYSGTDDDRVAALAAASRSPRTPVQQMAIARLKELIKEKLAGGTGDFSARRANVEGMLPLLGSLAATDGDEIAAYVPEAIRDLPDDPRMVRPLWECLFLMGIDKHKAECAQIVERLLRLATEPNAFAELAGQDSHDATLLSDYRDAAYPFRKGLDKSHNLVTLLAWAEYLKVQPARPLPVTAGSNDFLQSTVAETPEPLNRFFAAKVAGKLSSVENARRRTLRFSLCWPARVFSGALLVAALCLSAYGLVEHPGWLIHPFGWWTLALVFGLAITPIALFFVHAVKSDANENPPWFEIDDTSDSGHIVALICRVAGTETLDDPLWSFLILAVTTPFVFAISTVSLAKSSLAVYIISALIGQSFFLECMMFLFNRKRRYYLYRPNPYVDMYDDPKSRDWLVPRSSPGF